jgi:hypothetical protein
VGSQLTLLSDPATLPCLPLDILRQSTLGGGIIDSILGAGVLNVPGGSLGTAAVAGMTIPLHPVAIAGYISLFVNALSLLPIGSKLNLIQCLRIFWFYETATHTIKYLPRQQLMVEEWLYHCLGEGPSWLLGVPFSLRRYSLV